MLKVDDSEIKGTICVKDGMFQFGNLNEKIFAYNAHIEFIFNEQKHSFKAKNIGGKYFVEDYKNDLYYQRFTVLATLNQVLANHEIKPQFARPKL